MNLPELRENYAMAGLSRKDLHPCPFTQFEHWMEQALGAKLIEPNAMTLATADQLGRPSSRTVLLKGMDPQGFRFFTNYSSKKAQDLEANPYASLTFLWKELERQVCIRGKVTRTSRDISDEYFHSRPYGSQIGAWVSENQSREVPDRAFLEERDQEMMARFPENQSVPLPDFWGGYQLEPDHLEFWQGRPGRLHDRFCYVRNDGSWKISRLSP
ncbi:MAG: pyridoxamine 5'-phosphate oxidase [Verrucomicrobiaceae bacterium]